LLALLDPPETRTIETTATSTTASTATTNTVRERLGADGRPAAEPAGNPAEGGATAGTGRGGAACVLGTASESGVGGGAAVPD
jgi:hypothetical protein